MLGFGLFFLVMGKRYFPLAIFIVSFTTTAIFVTELLLISVLHDSTNRLAIIFATLSIILASSMIGSLLLKLERVGIATLSAWSGFVVSISLN